jgi:hypothetical protein
MTDPSVPELPPELVAADARRGNARQRLSGTVERLQARLNPLAMAQGAVERVAVGIMQDGVQAARERPRLVAAGAGLLGLLLLRKPLSRLFVRGARHATTARSNGLKSKRAPRVSKGNGK